MKAPQILGICAVISVGLFAQEAPPPTGAPGPMRFEPFRGQMRVRPYDKSKEETIKAKVIEAAELPRGPMTVVVLKVDVDGQIVQIPLGPKEHLKEKGMELAKGDEITIRGIKNAPPWQMAKAAPPADDKAERRDGKDAGKDSKDGKDKKPNDAPEKPKEGKAQPPKGATAADDTRMTLDRSQGDGPPTAMRIRAREVTKGGKTLTLLSDDGTPAWRPAFPMPTPMPTPMPAGTVGKAEQ